MTRLSAAQWLILDNLEHGWPYTTNLPRDMAEEAYLCCIHNGYVEDGMITPTGSVALVAKGPLRLIS